MKKLVTITLLASVVSTAFASLPYDSIVTAKSGRYGLDSLLVHALIQQESHHNPSLCSHVNACGLMQLMPATARELGVSNVFDPTQNVDGGTRYLKGLLGQFHNTVNSLRAYNWGPGNMRSYLRGLKKVMPQETVNYSRNIQRFYYAYGGKGSHFSGESGNTTASTGVKGDKPTANPALAKAQQATQGGACKPVKIASQKPIDFSNLPPLEIPTMPRGQGKTVFDPTKFVQIAQQTQGILEQIKLMRGQYDALTKGVAGLNLLDNISQIAGFELPNNLPTGFGQGKGGGAIYNTFAERHQADTGVVESPELSAAHNQAANIATHAYVEAELAWTQVNCSMNNLSSLANVNTESIKGAKDLSNRIALENALLQASNAKINTSITMLKTAMSNYDLAAMQAKQVYLSKATKTKDVYRQW